MARLILLALLLSACAPDTQVTAAAQPSQDDLLGGFAAGSSLAAVGSLGIVFEGTYYGALCTATLISANSVLAARHCGDGVLGTFDLYFAPGGEDAYAPALKYPLVAGVAVPGQDMFVFHTSEPLTDVTPIPLGSPLGANDFGRRYVAIGYGAQTPGQYSGAEPLTGSRKMGAVTLNALGGHELEHLFGTYAGFLASLSSSGVDVPACLADAICGKQLSDLWNTPLLDTEAFAGLQAGDVQVCTGDAGGPLLRMVTLPDGTRQRATFGVVSHGWFTAESPCYGAFYATFDPATLAFLGKELSWTDPCASAPVNGTCAGSVVTRCTTFGEGLRRISSYDCAAVDQQCVTLPSGKAGCADEAVSTPSNALVPAAVPAATQSPLSGGDAAVRLRAFHK